MAKGHKQHRGGGATLESRHDHEHDGDHGAPPPNPERIMKYLWGHAVTQLIITAIDMDLFSLIRDGASSIEKLADAAHASPRGVRIAVDALVSLGLIERHDSTLALPADTATYLTRDSRAYIGGVLKPTQMGWADWAQLPEAVKSGRSPHPRAHTNDRGDFFAEWVDGLFNLNYAAAQAVARKVAEDAHDALDIGAGSGVWSLASAQRNPDLRVVALDHQSVIDKVTRPFAERLGVANRYTWKPGNFRDLDLGTDAYDLIFLGHILHGEGERRSVELLRRCHQALRAEGVVVVAEMVADNERSHNTQSLIFAANMLMFTEEGDTFSTGQLELMARMAGFTLATWLEVPAPSPLLLIRKH